MAGPGRHRVRRSWRCRVSCSGPTHFLGRQASLTVTLPRICNVLIRLKIEVPPEATNPSRLGLRGSSFSGFRDGARTEEKNLHPKASKLLRLHLCRRIKSYTPARPASAISFVHVSLAATCLSGSGAPSPKLSRLGCSVGFHFLMLAMI